MEEAVDEGVGLQPRDSRHRVVAGGGQHVVPLQDLVQDDPVDEAAEAEAEQQAGAREVWEAITLRYPGGAE